jgi:oligopeptide transport system substrate-binding protein
MVIDRETIIKKVCKSPSTPAYGIVPPAGDPDYPIQRVSWADKPMAERIEIAKQLFKEAGYGPSNPITIEIRMQTDENSRKIMIAIASMWKSILGVDSHLVAEEFKVLVANRHKKEITQFFSDAWIGDYPDPTSFLDLFTTQAGLQNDPGYSNLKYDSLIEEAEKLSDKGKRQKKLLEAEKILLEDNVTIPFMFENWERLVKSYVKGYHASSLDRYYSKDITLDNH